MMKKIIPIAVFYVIAITCRFLSNQTDILSGLENAYLKAILTGIGPAIGALVVYLMFSKKPILTLKGDYSRLIIPISLYWILPIFLISAVSYYRTGELPWLSVLSILIYGLMEEIGWRGFLHHELKGTPRLFNILLVAVLWFIWHLNFELSFSNLLFLGILILGSWGIGKVADSTKSLLAVSAFHSLNNFFPKLEFPQLLILGSLILIWVLSLIARKKQKFMTVA